MANLPKYPPASVRPGPSSSRTNSTRDSEPRPYLLTLQLRKPGSLEKRFLPLFPHESEDARITGSTRSLYRRLLALNLPGVGHSIEVSKAAIVSSKIA
jgi:hypothetical protein